MLRSVLCLVPLLTATSILLAQDTDRKGNRTATISSPQRDKILQTLADFDSEAGTND